ncbi:MAG: FAD:protein FMN transferase [Bacteroidota bacterium]
MNRCIGITLGLILVFSSCSRNQFHRYSRESTAMETYLSVTIYDADVSQERADALVDSAFSEIRRIENVMTDYADTSEVGLINVNAGKDTMEVSQELAELLRKSFSFSEQSNGAFDVSVGPIVKAWDFLSSEPEIPSKSQMRMLRQLVGYKNIVVEGNKVFLNAKGMRIDLGGIAKGYAVDKAIEILKRNGVKNTIVDLGGNLGVWWDGTHSLDSAVAEILVRHPRKEGKFFGSLNVGTCGVSTSGDYQRCFIKDGVRYHHIINPATGYPAKDVVSVTIIADDAMTADALSTLVFVLGREKGMEFIKKSKDVEGLIVWEEGDKLSYELSPGLQGKFKRSDD